MLQSSDRRAAFGEEVRATTGIGEAMSARLIHGFYACRRQDAVLRPICRQDSRRRVPLHLERVRALVGVDRDCYRLGNGGGYYDRALARLDPLPRLIGAGSAGCRIPTIYPMP